MRVLVLLVVALLSAGCVGGETATLKTGSHETVEPTVIVDPAGIAGVADSSGDAPVWQLGDAWLAQSNDEGAEPESFVFVVTGASQDAYELSATSERLVAYDAMFDVSYVGPIRARDLAGAQEGQPIQYFDFPLADGKTWSTTWDSYTVTLKATKTAQGFDIVGTDEDGAPFVSYDYVPSMKWWSRIDFAGGYGFTIQRFTPDWKGEYKTATAQSIFDGSASAPVAQTSTGEFTVDDGQTFVLVSVAGGGTAWARAFGLLAPDGQPYMTDQVNNFETSGDAYGYAYEERLPPTPGTWHVTAPMLHDPSGWGGLHVHQVAVTSVAFG